MKLQLTIAMACLMAASVLAVACGQATPASTPTKAAAPAATVVPTKGAAPAATTAPAAAPTAVPAKKLDWPVSGKTLTFIHPYAPGGGADTLIRFMLPMLEKDLGISAQILNRPGGGTQTGITELSRSAPDGYTVGSMPLPSALPTYMDPSRNAGYSRKSFEPVALFTSDVQVLAVGAKTPYMTLEDVRVAAKENPGKIRVGDPGLTTGGHLTTIMLNNAMGVRLRPVHFDATAQAITAVIGGHIEGAIGATGTVSPHVKSGNVRVIAIADEQEVAIYPGVKTMAAQGYKVVAPYEVGFAAPAGTPKEIVSALSGHIKKLMEDEALKKKAGEIGSNLKFMTPEQFGAHWADTEESLKPVLEEALRPD